MAVLGLDTSNYTTSAAVFDGAGGCNAGQSSPSVPGNWGCGSRMRCLHM